MPRETNAAKRERAIEVCERLNRRYGPVECFLDHENPFRLLIAVLLSAQTTDAQVNKVTPRLFAQWPTPEAMAGASVADVADTIKSLGFYKSKAKHAVEAAQMIVADYGGEVPADMKELVKLPGVGRKTANIVLNVGYGIVEGIAVDTHVNRIAHRLMLSPKTHAKEPLKTEQDLLKILPHEYWESVNHQWITFGREICNARKPKSAGRFVPQRARDGVGRNASSSGVFCGAGFALEPEFSPCATMTGNEFDERPAELAPAGFWRCDAGGTACSFTV